VHLEENVKMVLSMQDVLNINRTRKFARKARDYKLTYYYLIHMRTDTVMAKGDDGRVTKDLIKHIVKAFKI
jgi:hypothetical protein